MHTIYYKIKNETRVIVIKI